MNEMVARAFHRAGSQHCFNGNEYDKEGEEEISLKRADATTKYAKEHEIKIALQSFFVFLRMFRGSIFPPLYLFSVFSRVSWFYSVFSASRAVALPLGDDIESPL
jgi:hypothetical protein